MSKPTTYELTLCCPNCGADQDLGLLKGKRGAIKCRDCKHRFVLVIAAELWCAIRPDHPASKS